MSDESSAPTREELAAEIKRRGLSARPRQGSPERDAIAQELRRRGLSPDLKPAFPNESIGPATGNIEPFSEVMGRRLPTGLQYDLARTDTPEEVRKLLISRGFGVGDIHTDPAGNVFVKYKGKTYPARAAFATEVVATAPGSVGAIGGAAIGFGVGGPIGAPIGAGLGYVVGKGGDELVKAAQGFYGKSVSEELKTMLGGALFNAVFSEVPGAAASATKALGRLFRRFVVGEAPAESKVLTPKLLEAGARPPMASVDPSAQTLKYEQLVRNLVGSDPNEARNLQYVDRQRQRILSLAGISDDEIDTTLAEINNPTAAVSRRATGQGVVGRVQDVIAHYAAQEDAALARADTELKSLDASVKQFADMNKNNMSQEVADAIKTRRAAWGKVMSAGFDRVENMAGGARFIPTQPIIDAVNQAVELLPPAAQPALLTRIGEMLYFTDAQGELHPRPFISITDAHRIESEASAAAFPRMGPPTMTPDPTAHYLGEIADSVDAAYSAAVGRPEVIAALRKWQNVYRIGINKYKDAALRQLVARGTRGLSPDPATVAQLIADPGEGARARFLIGIMDKTLRQKVASADLLNIMWRAGELSGGDVRQASGISLMKALEERGDLLDTVHGRQGAALMREYASKLAARQGKLDLTQLPQDDFARALQRYVMLDEARERFVAEHPLRALVRGTSEDIDKAYSLAVRPGSEAVTEEVMNFLGPNSPEWRSVQRQWLKEVIANATRRQPSGDPLIIGDAMENELAKYTLRQRQMLAPGGVDRDLIDLAKETRFLFPFKTGAGDRDMGASLRAASIKAHLPWSAPRWLYARFMGWIADRPTLMRALTSTLKGPSNERLVAQRALKILYMMFLNTNLAGPPPFPKRQTRPARPTVLSGAALQ